MSCWGANYHGQLGNDSVQVLFPTPQPVVSGGDWVQVAAGWAHTCAIDAAGRLFCWGRGDAGALGTDSTESSAVPLQESSGRTDWERVSAEGRSVSA